MARILITTLGSSGDLNPFVAIGLGLRARGHQVTYAVEDTFQPQLRALDFPIAPLTGGAEQALMEQAHALVSRATPMASLRALVNEVILPSLRAHVAELRAACAEADILVSGAPMIPASFAADLTHIRWASVALSPVFIPSASTEPQPLPSEDTTVEAIRAATEAELHIGTDVGVF